MKHFQLAVDNIRIRSCSAYYMIKFNTREFLTLPDDELYKRGHSSKLECELNRILALVSFLTYSTMQIFFFKLKDIQQC